MGMKRTPNDISKEEGALQSSLLKNQNQNLLPSGPNRLELLFGFPGL